MVGETHHFSSLHAAHRANDDDAGAFDWTNTSTWAVAAGGMAVWGLFLALMLY